MLKDRGKPSRQRKRVENRSPGPSTGQIDVNNDTPTQNTWKIVTVRERSCRLECYKTAARIDDRVRLRGATVARLTPDQKVACSNHVGVMFFLLNKENASCFCAVMLPKHLVNDRERTNPGRDVARSTIGPDEKSKAEDFW